MATNVITPSHASNNQSIIEGQSRELPSELRARPKILRTPMEGMVKNNQVQNSQVMEIKEEIKENQGKGVAVVNMESPFMNEKKFELRVIF